ncbi:MAG: NUDIX domain-containing protein [Alphaproteobacteria bacterium]|nr:MAG: NUDIX domain-containing protein [Alphaproteobacteria bacterium]
MDVFLGGSLDHPPLLRAVLGGAPGALRPARLDGYRAALRADRLLAAPMAAAGDALQGQVARLDDDAAARLGFHAAAFGLEPVEEVATAEGHEVRVLLWRVPEGARGDWPLPFDAAGWAAELGPVAEVAAAEILWHRSRGSAAGLSRLLHVIHARAQSRVSAAEDTPPQNVRSGLTAADVEVLGTRHPYLDFFRVDEVRLRHRLFDGGWSAPVERAGFLMTEAVTVLPYDPVRDRVLLVEQFRAGPFLRGAPAPWTLEAIAGRRDAGETHAETARREAMEEARLTLGALHEVARYYPTPGAVTEYVVSYVGIADLGDAAARIAGAAAEHEDIRAHVLGFPAAMELLSTGEADTAPLILSLMWLAANRDRLRAA